MCLRACLLACVLSQFILAVRQLGTLGQDEQKIEALTRLLTATPRMSLVEAFHAMKVDVALDPDVQRRMSRDAPRGNESEGAYRKRVLALIAEGLEEQAQNETVRLREKIKGQGKGKHKGNAFLCCGQRCGRIMQTDELAALVAYTGALRFFRYPRLGRVLREYDGKNSRWEDGESEYEVSAYFPYLRILSDAHRHYLEGCGGQANVLEVFRGIYSCDRVSPYTFNVGDKITWWSPTSTSFELNTAVSFAAGRSEKCSQTKIRHSVVFRINIRDGNGIDMGSIGFDNEQEFFVLPMTTFEIKNVETLEAKKLTDHPYRFYGQASMQWNVQEVVLEFKEQVIIQEASRDTKNEKEDRAKSNVPKSNSSVTGCIEGACKLFRLK
eukprot:TRINITY_DN21995_c0_g1_i1.p1 TRINITY_DN21995_c0_g1~~TRINITY_DN21995_c0_g1_i1.p1  ORF type:complete len:382 (+),score=27.89 TRINITY_DN21995_c0_g1_i1:87-1232(+)